MKPKTDINIRFWNRVNKDGPILPKMITNCWEYVSKVKHHSPKVFVGAGIPDIPIAEYSWKCFFEKEIPIGSFVIRRCQNNKCVRPEHLFIGEYKNLHEHIIYSDDGLLYKKCSKCKELKSLDSFYFTNKENLIRDSRCKECNTIKNNEYQARNWEKIAFLRTQDLRTSENMVVDLSEDDIKDLWVEQRGKCYWLGIDLEPSPIHRYPYKPSLDRLNRSLGYTKDNVVLCSIFSNVGRNSCSVRDFVDAMKKNLQVFGNGVWITDDKWKKYYD